MRADALGFFWEDVKIEKALKAPPEKKRPPERIWESPDYLPGLEEALAFNVPRLTREDLLVAPASEELLFDVEVYPNYFLCSFEAMTSGKVMCFELSPWQTIDQELLHWVVNSFCLVGFNSIKFDACILALAMAGENNATMHWATEQLILSNERPQEILKQRKVKKLKINHIDLIEVAPLRASLKIYGGRLHTKRMQDLPFPPGTVLSFEQAAIVKFYNINDLRNTRDLRVALAPQIELRYQMSNEYGQDLRSKSDAQIAEAVFAQEVGKLNGARPTTPEIEIGTAYKYNMPSFIRFQSELMQWVAQGVAAADFVVGEHGSIETPAYLKGLEIELGASKYRMGIGGLHSCEESAMHFSDKQYTLRDRDAVSFYPKVILNQHLYPQHMGVNFLRVYYGIVSRRIDAKKRGQECKRNGDKVGERAWKNIAESLKILINGSFGKLGSKYSILYAPDLLVQTTISGQLLLLMLIERFELVGIHVVSANTDGIVVKVPNHRQEEYLAIIKQWETDTDFETEETVYLALLSRDINNYIAVKEADKSGAMECKTKGIFANPWSVDGNIEPRLHKNPTNQICVEALEKMLSRGIAISDTIRACTDITKFISVRSVTGGAVELTNKTEVKDYLGKSIRWYYATGREGMELVYAKNGNKVPRSDGAKPLMDLPDACPTDIDYDWYVAEAESMLKDVGYL